MDPFRSPLLRTSRLISLPPGTEMFQFPGFASLRREMTAIAGGRVAPFGHLGITACVPLPRASRSLPRPSSPLCAQASPTCLLSLDYKKCQADYARCYRNLPLIKLTHPKQLTPLRHANSMRIRYPRFVAGQKTFQTDDPSSVLHFSISSPRFDQCRKLSR